MTKASGERKMTRDRSIWQNENTGFSSLQQARDSVDVDQVSSTLLAQEGNFHHQF